MAAATSNTASIDDMQHAAGAEMWPSSLDMQRAVIASACTYHNATWCSRRHPLIMEHLHFSRVLFPDPERPAAASSAGVHNLILAMAAVDPNLRAGADFGITLFVAFPGTRTFFDLLHHLDTPHSDHLGNGFLMGGVPGQYHTGFIQRLEEIFPSMLPLCEFIREQRVSRLIFCGHSLGGALAHLALIKFAVTTSHVPWLDDFLLERPISIAFGSPPFCDAEAVRDFIDASGLAKQMFTFIDEADPVPSLLEEDKAVRKAIFMRRIRRSCSLGQCLRFSLSVTPRAENIGRSRFRNLQGFYLLIAAWWRASYITTFKMDSRKAPLYVRAGLYWGADQSGPADAKPAQSLCLDLSLKYHSMESYVARVCSELLSADRPPQFKQSVRGDRKINVQQSMFVSEIGPHIGVCVLRFGGRHETRKEAKIIVEGENLSLCQSWQVSRKGSGEWRRSRRLSWSLERCTDSKVVLNLENEVDDAMVSFLTGRTVLAVSMGTPFGMSRKCRVQAQHPRFDSCVKCVMSCFLAKLFLMQSCSGQPLTKCCAKALATLLSHNLFPAPAFMTFMERAEGQQFDVKFDFAWERFAEPAIHTLRKGMKASKAELSKFTNANLGGCLFPWCSTIWVSYRTCLEILFQQLMTNIKQTDTSRLDYDERIMPAGRRQTSFFEYEVHAHWGQIHQILEAQTGAAQAGTLLRKGRTIYNIFGAHDILGKVRTVVFVGGSFAGKSTLINSLLDRRADSNGASTVREVQKLGGAWRKAPEAMDGRERREAEVEAVAMHLVQLTSGEEVPVMLVEVPGSWGAERPWAKLVHVADLVVVVASFAGETALQAEVLADGARRLGRCSNILVVVNGMDRVLHGSSSSRVWQKYNSHFLGALKLEFSRSSRVPPSNVLMSVAIPDEALEDTTLQNLQRLSPLIQFRDDIARTLQRSILDLPHHHHH